MGVYYWIKGLFGLVAVAILFPLLMIVADLTHSIYYAFHETVGGPSETRQLFERLFGIITTSLTLVIPILMIAFFLYIIINSARRDGREEVVYG